ncbi:MAG: hypothetical protein AAF957_13965 [Planctomycetota bacterium]
MRTGLALAAVALVAFLAGAVVDPFGASAAPTASDGRPEVARRTPEPEAVETSPEVELRAPRREVPEEPPGEMAPEPPMERTELTVEPGDVFGRALLEHHASEFARGWSEVRADEPSQAERVEGEADFRRQTLALSASLGQWAAEARTRLEELAVSIEADDGPAMLAAYVRNEWRPDDDLFEGDALERITRAPTSAAAVDGIDFLSNRGEKLEDGVTLTFGPGVFTLDERRIRASDGDRIPNDLTIVGVGRNATLLQMGDLGGRGTFERLTFRDITLDAQNDGLFDHRHDGASVSFQRARIVRFDAAHGGSTIFSFRGGAFIDANDLEIIGGYGRAPGQGDLVRGGPMIGRFRNCRFELVELRRMRSWREGRLEFTGCSFTLVGPDPREWASWHLAFHGCSYGRMELTADDDGSKSLQDLFPDAR